MDNNLPYNDSLDYHFPWLLIIPDFDPVNSGYELLLSSGVSSITNDSLRRDVSYLYSNTYNWIEKFYSFIKNNSHSFVSEQLVPKLDGIELFGKSRPYSFKELKKDQELRSYIEYHSEFFKTMKEGYQERLLLAEELIRRIKEEVKRLEEE